jgi:hypothetical protein
MKKKHFDTLDTFQKEIMPVKTKQEAGLAEVQNNSAEYGLIIIQPNSTIILINNTDLSKKENGRVINLCQNLENISDDSKSNFVNSAFYHKRFDYEQKTPNAQSTNLFSYCEPTNSELNSLETTSLDEPNFQPLYSHDFLTLENMLKHDILRMSQPNLCIVNEIN